MISAPAWRQQEPLVLNYFSYFFSKYLDALFV